MSLYYQRFDQPWPGQEHNHFKTSNFTTHGHVHASSGPLTYGLLSGHDLDRHFAHHPVKGEALRQMDPAYLQPADPRLASHFVAADPGAHCLLPSVGVPYNSHDTVIYVDSCGSPGLPVVAVEAPTMRVVQRPEGVLLAGLTEVPSHQPSADMLTDNSSIAANPWLPASLLPVFTDAGLHAYESPQLPGSLRPPYTNQELYWQQLYWQQLYWHWYMQSYYSHLAYLEQWHIACHQNHMDNMAKQKRMTPPQQMGMRKKEALSEDVRFFSDTCSGLGTRAEQVQTPSRAPNMDMLSQEPVACDAVVTQEGEVLFSEHVLDLLKSIPRILDLAAEMGFSV